MEMANVIQDLRYAIRILVKRPGFTIIVLLILALGIGSTTAIFSVFYGVVLKPLPFRNPDDLVMVWSANRARGWNDIKTSLSPPAIFWIGSIKTRSLRILQRSPLARSKSKLGTDPKESKAQNAR